MKIGVWQGMEGCAWAMATSFSVSEYIHQKNLSVRDRDSELFNLRIESVSDIVGLVDWVANSVFLNIKNFFQKIGFSNLVAVTNFLRAYISIDQGIIDQVNKSSDVMLTFGFQSLEGLDYIKEACKVGRFFSSYILSAFFALSCVNVFVPGALGLGVVGSLFTGIVLCSAIKMAYSADYELSRCGVEMPLGAGVFVSGEEVLWV